MGGLGNATTYTGMTWAGFRPSDEESGKYNVPVNALVALAMRKTADLCRGVYGDGVLASLAEQLAKDIEDGIRKHGIMTARSQTFDEKIYAYETDGLGSFSALDDANLP